MQYASWFVKLNAIPKGTILHPQWLTDRCHANSKTNLKSVKDSLIVDIGSGNSNYSGLIDNTNTIVRLDYPMTNKGYLLEPNVFADACDLPIKSKSVDVVIFLEVLEHIANPEASLREISRILKYNGQLFISVPFVYPVHDAPHDYRRFTVFGIRQLLDDNHLQVKTEICHGNSITTIIQMSNLTLLEIMKNSLDRSVGLALLCFMLIYPICILQNLISLIFIPLSWESRLYFGYFIIACRNNENE